jgi:hypothetical protein
MARRGSQYGMAGLAPGRRGVRGPLKSSSALLKSSSENDRVHDFAKTEAVAKPI